MADMRRHVPIARLARLTAVLSVPFAATLIGLVAGGWLHVVPALGGAVLTGVALLLLLRPLMGDLMGVAFYLRNEADDDHPSRPPEIRFSETGGDIVVAAYTLRARLRRRLAQAEAQADFHGAVARNLPIPLLIIAQDGMVQRANAAAAAVLGREPEKKALTTIIRDPSTLEAVDAVLGGARRQTVHLTLGGTVERAFDVTVEPLPDTGNGRQAMILLHDVTPLVRAEQMRADFVANASHELRTPLTSVLGFIETLRGPARDDTEAHERFLGIMYQQAVRMKRLIEDLLSLSRIELHEHTQPTDSVDLAEIVQGVAEGLQLQIQNKNMRLAVEIPDDLPSALGDPDELTQVIQNLLTNAVKYGLDGTNVTVTARLAERGPAAMPQATRTDCLALTVRDHGEGIAKEHLPRLTERFYRVDTARSRQLGGTGLGLAIVKHIVNRHRGALSIDSTVGEGSAFTVYLPRFGQRPGSLPAI